MHNKTKRFKKNLLIAPTVLLALLCNDLHAAVLEEVIVSAQKRDETLSDVPISISVLSQENMDKFQVDDLFDVANFIPGMVFARAPDDGLALSFRGVASSPRNQAYEQSVGVFLDGVFFGKGRLYSAGMFDLARTEIIMGTQSTLLGKNTSVGAISMVSKKPGDEVGGYAQLTVSEHGGFGVKGAVDFTISENFKTRIAGYYSEMEGATKNIATGNSIPIEDNHAIRLTTTWEASEKFDMTFMYQQTQDKKLGDSSQIDQDPNGLAAAIGINDSSKLDGTVSKSTRFGEDGEAVHEIDSDIVNLVFNWYMDNHTFTSQSTYTGYDLAFVDDIDLQPGDFVTLIREEDYSQFTQEFRITSTNNETLEYMAGIYYFTSDWQSDELDYWAYPAFPPVAGGPFVPGDLFNGPYLNSFQQDVDYWSLFVSATWHVSDNFRIAAGLRYADEEKKARMGRTEFAAIEPNVGSLFAPNSFWNTIANPPFAETPMDYSDDIINGNLNVQYHISDDTMLYAAYGHGTKTGGFAESNTVPTGNPNLEARIESETVDNYEVGFKSTLLDGQASLNGALFYMDVEGLQQTIFNGASFISTNVDAQSMGAELSSMLQLGDAWTLNGGVVYAEAEEKDSGLKLSPAPRWTGNIGLSFEQTINSGLLLSLQGNLHYRSSQFNQIQESIPASDSLATLDLTASLASADERWKISLIGRNVTNEISQDFGYPSTHPLLGGVINGSTNALRTYLLQLTYNF